MEILKWTILIVSFAFAENDAKELYKDIDPEYLNITGPFNKISREMFLTYTVTLDAVGFRGRTIEEELDGNKIKIKSEECHSEIKFLKNNSKVIQIEAQSFVSFDFYLREYNHNFVTETFPLIYTISSFDKYDKSANNKDLTWNNDVITSITFPNLENVDIKLLPSDYKYKSNDEEVQIKKKIKSLFASFVDEKFKTINDIRAGLTYIKGLITSIESIAQSSVEFYYSIDNISTAEYTVTNITIKGFGEVESIFVNASSNAEYATMKLSNVQGHALATSAGKPLKVEFGMDSVYIFKSHDNFAKFKVKYSGDWYKNQETKTPLADGSLPNFKENLEAAFTNTYAKA